MKDRVRTTTTTTTRCLCPLHHSDLRGQKKARAGEEESEFNNTAKVRKTPPPQPVLFSLYEEEPGGGRPASLAEPPGPQERIQRRTVEQLAEIAPMVQILDAPVPQSVVQLVEVLRPCDTMVPEQVIDVPKITSTDLIPQRAVPRVPQMAEQLVDEPVPSFDDFELVQVGEEEEEQPRMVPGSRVRDAHGRSWCRVVGPAGIYWWMIGTSTAQWTLHPEGITAKPGRYFNTGRRGDSGG